MKRWRTRFLTGIVLLLVGAVASWYGLRFYHFAQQPKLIEEARSAQSRGDFAQAAIIARRVLQVDPQNIDGWRLMADLSGEFGLPESVDWRGRVFAREPDRIENLAALVKTALKFKDYETVSAAIAESRERFADDARFYGLNAAAALASGNLEEARNAFARVAELDAGEPRHRLNLASLDLVSRDPAENARALDELEQLTAHAHTRARALATLLGHALKPGSGKNAYPYAMKLVNTESAKLSDRLYALRALRRMQAPEYPSLLSDIQRDAAGIPSDVYDIISWMNNNDDATEAISWSQTLVDGFIARAPLAIAVVESYLLLRDWAGLQAWIDEVDWTGFEYVRTFLVGHRRIATGESGAAANFDRYIRRAARESSESTGSLKNLIELSRAWGWDQEREALLWMRAGESEQEPAALRQLFAFYRERKNTRGLYRVMLRAYSRDSDDLVARNNLANFGLLLGRDLERTHRLANAVYAENPGHVAFASTYAFSLYRKKEYQAAFDVLRMFPPEQLRSKSVAPYYASILAALGKKEEAESIAANLQENEFLREEWALLDGLM
jgi:Flp pilus assembly protein TadD